MNYTIDTSCNTTNFLVFRLLVTDLAFLNHLGSQQLIRYGHSPEVFSDVYVLEQVRLLPDQDPAVPLRDFITLVTRRV